MNFQYGQGYPATGMHPPPGGAPYGGAPHGGAPYGGAPYGGAPYGGAPYGGYGVPGQGVPYRPGPGAHPRGPYPGMGGHAPAGPYPGMGGHAPAGPYGGYGAAPPPLGGAYGRQTPAVHAPPPGNIPPGVNPEAFRLFQSVDTDRGGSISVSELRQALINSNWSTFSEETCRIMINMFDRTGKGCLDVFGFTALWTFMLQWKAVFLQFDRDRSGTIDGTELHQAFVQMGYNVSPQFTQAVAARFTVQGGRPGVQLDRFIQLCTQMQSMTQAFKQRDQAMKGSVRLSYEDFLSGTITRLM